MLESANKETCCILCSLVKVRKERYRSSIYHISDIRVIIFCVIRCIAMNISRFLSFVKLYDLNGRRSIGILFHSHSVEKWNSIK